ncbi:hypothetical protein BWGOE4_05980 [Bacillus mycoides]|nr:hypothetical protein IEM_04865 [Bacillus cereus BAG6O-2]OFD48427.1 hypothetical protein BWGOE2_05840 [Bacillus mycoides]OFD50652.1 hypothetical protein BWGOE1_05990 [Bacillus mycoides]OFD66788.1 hypothetical protein BWGOE4_05980 [Bacillus mycoides]OFD69219.1 hypothetical protein BWGOE7_05690 [Bacillus mycoides]
MTEQNNNQQTNKTKPMFPSLAENINYIENKLSHSDDIKKLDVPFQNGKGTSYISNL